MAFLVLTTHSFLGSIRTLKRKLLVWKGRRSAMSLAPCQKLAVRKSKVEYSNSHISYMNGSCRLYRGRVTKTDEIFCLPMLI